MRKKMGMQKKEDNINIGWRDVFYLTIILMIGITAVTYNERIQNQCNPTHDPYKNTTSPNLNFNFCCYEPDCNESAKNPPTCHCIYTKDCTPITIQDD